MVLFKPGSYSVAIDCDATELCSYLCDGPITAHARSYLFMCVRTTAGSSTRLKPQT